MGVGIELKLIEGLPHHKVPKELHEKHYDLLFLLAKSEDAPWLIQEVPKQERIQETADYVFGIFRNEQPEEENPVVNIEHAFSLTKRDCSRLADMLKERPGFGVSLPYKSEVGGVTFKLQRTSADHYWLGIDYPSRLANYGVSSDDLSLISKLFKV